MRSEKETHCVSLDPSQRRRRQTLISIETQIERSCWQAVRQLPSDKTRHAKNMWWDKISYKLTLRQIKAHMPKICWEKTSNKSTLRQMPKVCWDKLTLRQMQTRRHFWSSQGRFSAERVVKRLCSTPCHQLLACSKQASWSVILILISVILICNPDL